MSKLQEKNELGAHTPEEISQIVDYTEIFPLFLGKVKHTWMSSRQEE